MGTESVLQHELNEENMHRCFRLFEEKRTKGEIDLAVATLLLLKLRSFSPWEVANLMFSSRFLHPTWSDTLTELQSLRKQLNVHVVSLLLKYLLNDP